MRERERERDSERERERERERQTDRQTDRETDRQRERERDRQTDRQTDRQRQTETEKETQRQRERETDKDRQTDSGGNVKTAMSTTTNLFLTRRCEQHGCVERFFGVFVSILVAFANVRMFGEYVSSKHGACTSHQALRLGHDRIGQIAAEPLRLAGGQKQNGIFFPGSSLLLESLL